MSQSDCDLDYDKEDESIAQIVEVKMSDALAELSGKKILVTGASGFLGSHLCDRLCQNGAEVHAISRTERTTDRELLHWWQGNVEDLEVVQNLFQTIQPQIVFHLSGLITGVAGLELVLPTFHSLVVSTVNILTVATQMQCDRIVTLGSLEEPEPKQGEIAPISPYSAAKWASVAYSRMFHHLYQTPVVLVRPFMTYGPRQPIHKIIPSVTLSLLQGEAPKLASGTREVDWIYVDDVIDGMLAAARVAGVEGSIFDLGSGNLVSIRSLVEQLTQIINPQIKPLFGALPDRPVEKVRVANITLTSDKLDWQPKISLETGLVSTVDWFRQQSKAERT
ncbi:SDR family NAD(P)-dependent oxidoreductase [Chroococcidiopsis sp. FACHB-1243]|uniref:NAD-dependent epimerase/dehydratase family protein n=1 Tax=Chroococcidiopsis sp. [FACHB-1243] TaxID=2692781 RepID=UPI00177DBD4B|nr:SDR family NAD(P)-dependent oxidoreductase [Chroococcidiopsis sp. [FACHB-1243]]MBD2306532.1 SDR family NAD(P)-dependent oxidoreductase [Chroococcidiopsis sp. [FACHB-1243]]